MGMNYATKAANDSATDVWDEHLSQLDSLDREIRKGLFNNPKIQALHSETWEKRRKAVLAAAREAIDEVAEELARSPSFEAVFAELHYFVVLDDDLRKKLLSLNEKFKAE